MSNARQVTVEAFDVTLGPVEVLLVGIVASLFGVVGTVVWMRYEYRTAPYDLTEHFDESFRAAAADERDVLDTVAQLQQESLAPAAVEWETRAAKVGEQWTSTLTIPGYPDYPADGYLNELFNLTTVEFDCTVRLRPLNQERARDDLRNRADDLSIDSGLEDGVRGSYLQTRAQRAASTYAAVENGQRVFSQSMVVTVRADTRDELDESVRTIRRRLRDYPANLTPKTAVGRQDLALKAASPLGPNQLGREATVLGGAVGALLSSAHNPTILEPDGVEVGVHRHNNSPVVIDAFARENGYAMFTVGEPGSGKSFGSKQNFLRSIMQSDDRIGVVLEPLNNWTGVAEALDAQRITVGGNMGLNPLDIKPMPERIRQQMSDDASPFKGKKDDDLSFLTNYFALRGVTLGDRRTTLELALDHAYERAGITEDPSTHDRESPTLRTVLDILTEMTEAPESFIVRTEEETAKIETDAPWLIDQLRPFAEDGRYENLGEPTEFDIRDERVIYLDLGQQEGTVGGSTSLLMQLLISLVYERAKETDKEVVFVIDEARYIMQDTASLGFLETVFRHHRHHDLSIRLVTQTVDEFFQHPEAEAILDQCAIKQFHRLSGMDETWANEFGLNHAQMRFVQNAIPGNDRLGYSEALVGVDGEWRGIEVRAMEQETEVIE